MNTSIRQHYHSGYLSDHTTPDSVSIAVGQWTAYPFLQWVTGPDTYVFSVLKLRLLFISFCSEGENHLSSPTKETDMSKISPLPVFRS